MNELVRLVRPTYYYNRNFPFIKLSVAIVAFAWFVEIASIQDVMDNNKSIQVCGIS